MLFVETPARCKIPMKLCASLLLALFGLTPAHALEWKATHQSVKAIPLQSTAEAIFEFTNRADKPVTILSVNTSCDCLDAEPSEKVIAPGGSGSIRARFTVGDRSGLIQRVISVATDESDVPIALTAELTVPEIATLTPRSIEWPLRGPADTKIVEVAVAESVSLAINSVRSTSDAFNARLETVDPGRRYRIHLTPASTTQPVSAAFRIHATAAAAAGQAVIFSAYGNVR
jgi:hypothetical protein